MKMDQRTPLKNFLRYSKVLMEQVLVTREYIYYWVLATLLDIALTQTIHQWAWAFLAAVNLVIGVCGIAAVVRPIDRAFESLPLDYSKGYGRPLWLVEGKEPLKTEVLKVRAAGFSSTDYEKYLSQLSSRLCQPIKEIRKPSAERPVVEVVLKRQALPSSVEFDELPLQDLAQGEFFVGKTADGFEKLNLAKMTHMLVAGQTGAGKTQFIRQLFATLLTQTRHCHVALIDMKGGVDFQPYQDLPNFEIAADYESAEILLDHAVSLFEKRRDYILQKKKSHWNEFRLTDLEKEPIFNGQPIGPILIVVDELAELSRKATERSSKSELQEKIATLARLSRFTGIHLILGTQRPDKSTIDMQIKDNLPTRVCFSVPSVAASTLVVGDMTASTLGHHPGRAVYQLTGSKLVQAPLITNARLTTLLDPQIGKLKQAEYNRKLIGLVQFFPPEAKERMRVK